jgi:hypothetical protein
MLSQSFFTKIEAEPSEAEAISNTKVSEDISL